MKGRSSAPLIPTDILEQRAVEQRRRLHNSMVELKDTLKERLDVKRTARDYLVPAAGGVALVGLALGWGFGGFFRS